MIFACGFVLSSLFIPLLFLGGHAFPTSETLSTIHSHAKNKRAKLSSSHHNNDMSLSSAARHVGKLHPERTLLLLCDMQERFRPLIYKMESVIQTSRYLTSVATALDIPIVGTQQYTKVFGQTLPDCFADPETLTKLQESNRIFEKKLFSMLTPEVKATLASDYADKDTFVLVGIETHVCVQQTCLDLLEQGKDVHVIVDGVSSQQPIDREIALQRMQAAGAYLTTAQSASFMLMQSAEHPVRKR